MNSPSNLAHAMLRYIDRIESEMRLDKVAVKNDYYQLFASNMADMNTNTSLTALAALGAAAADD